MKVAIVGAGLTGLSAAFHLKDSVKVTIFEREHAGGLVSSYCPNYCIEKFYHHCFRRDDELLKLIRKLNLSSKLVWRIARIGQEYNGKIYPLNTLIEILRYPGMSLMDKIKLAKFTLNCKNLNEFKKFDDVNVVEGIKRELGNELFNSFFLPLLKSKFGELYKDVSYAWLLARVSIRSNRKRGGEELGYLRHGFQQLIDKLLDNLTDVEIVRENVKSITKNKKWIINGENFDAILWTAPVPVLENINFQLKLQSGIKDIKYQSSVCLLLSLSKAITEDIYWSNVNCTFGAIIEHTHFMPFEDYGEYLVYLAGYTHPESNLMKYDEDLIKKLYLKELEKFGVKPNDVNWVKVFRAKYSGPIYETGYLRKITPYKTKIDGFYIAGMTSEPNYPERSMNGSIKAGREVAEVILKHKNIT